MDCHTIHSIEPENGKLQILMISWDIDYPPVLIES